MTSVKKGSYKKKTMKNKRSMHKKQFYNMKGCSYLNCQNKLKGGSSSHISPALYPLPVNINGTNPLYPNTGPLFLPNGVGFVNAQPQKGGQRGGCGCGIMSGGNKKTQICYIKHRKNNTCKKRHMQKGGNSLPGSAWTSNPSTWPGVSGMGNYLELNRLPIDLQTSIINTGANPPYSIGGSKKQKKIIQRGGLGDFGQEIILNNVNAGSNMLTNGYRGLMGEQAAVSPYPWVQPKLTIN